MVIQIMMFEVIHNMCHTNEPAVRLHWEH